MYDAIRLEFDLAADSPRAFQPEGLPMSMRSAALLLTSVGACWLATVEARGQERFTPPSSPRREYNFDADWRFFKESKDRADGAEAMDFDDSQDRKSVV